MNYYKYDGYNEMGSSNSLGDFQRFEGNVTEDLHKNLFIIPDLMVGSDYSGDTITQSNHDVFLEKFKDIKEVSDIWGGYNTYGIAIRLDAYINNKEIKKIIDNLEKYPIIDEEAHSTLMNKREEEAIVIIVEDLCLNIDLEEYIPDCDTLLEDTDTIQEYAYLGINELNLDFEHETTSAYLDPDNLQPYVEDRLLLEHCKKIPLLINRKWSCEETRILYTEKFTQPEVTNG